MSKSFKQVLVILLSPAIVFGGAIGLQRTTGIEVPAFIVGLASFALIAILWIIVDPGDSDGLTGGF